MRKFSKKIAMMMVLAMLVSMFSGIVSASAAEKKSIWSAKSVDDDHYAVVMGETIEVKRDEFINFDLFKNIDGEDVEATEAGYEYTWESSDEDVIFIGNKPKKNGYARANKEAEIGAEATITVTFKNLTTGKSAERSFDVVVVEELKADAEEADYTIETKVGEVELGEEVLYLDTAYTFAGKVYDVDEKEVEKAEVKYFIDEKEIKFPYNFEKDGEFVITATATLDKEVIAEAEYAVYVVNNNVFEVEQTSMNSFKMTFLEKKDVEAAAKNKADFIVNKAASADAKVTTKQFVKSVDADKDNNAVIVTLYNDFAKDEVLSVVYKKETGSFQAVKGTVTTVKVEGGKVMVNSTLELKDKIKLYDEFGVNITSAGELAKVTVAAVAGNTNAILDAANKKLTFWADGKDITIKASYRTDKFENGKAVMLESEPAVFTSVKTTTVYGEITAWTVTTETNKDKIVWNGENRLAKGDSNYYVIGKLDKTSTNTSVKVDATNTYAEQANLKFSSTDPSVALVDGFGKLTPVSKGQTDIVVMQDKTVLGVFTVEVVDARKAVAMTITANKAALISAADSIELKLNIVDQYNAPYYTKNIEIKDYVYNLDRSYRVVDNNKIVLYGSDVVVPTDAKAATGKFSIKVKNTDAVAYFDLSVQKVEGGAVSFAFNQESITVDTSLASNTDKTFAELYGDKEIKVLGYDKNSMLVSTAAQPISGLNPAGVGTIVTGATLNALYVEVKAADSNNTWVANGAHVSVTTGNAVMFDYMDVTGAGDIIKAPAGNYIVNLYKVVAAGDNFVYELCDNLVITVKDAQKSYNAEVRQNTSTNQVAADVYNVTGSAFYAAVNEVFKFTYDGKEVGVTIYSVPADKKTDYVVGSGNIIVFQKISVRNAFTFKDGSKYFKQDIILPTTPITGK